MGLEARVKSVLSFAKRLGSGADGVRLIRYDGEPTAEALRCASSPLHDLPEAMRSWVCRDVCLRIKKEMRAAASLGADPPAPLSPETLALLYGRKASRNVGGVPISAVRLGAGSKRWAARLEETGTIVPGLSASTQGELWARLEMDYRQVSGAGNTAWRQCLGLENPEHSDEEGLFSLRA